MQEATADTVLEVDEIFSYILVKIKEIRIWIAQNKQTKQIVSFFIGDRSMESCKRLWRKLLYGYLRCRVFQILGNHIIVCFKKLMLKLAKQQGLLIM